MADALTWALDFVISLALLSFLFAAIYKILPDKSIAWGDVAVGSVVTALLFTIGKSLIGLYIGSSQVASSYGAGGGADRHPAMGVLFGSDLPIRRRNHARLRGATWHPRRRFKGHFRPRVSDSWRADNTRTKGSVRSAVSAIPDRIIRRSLLAGCTGAAAVLSSQLLVAGLVALVLFLHARDRHHRPAPG